MPVRMKAPEYVCTKMSDWHLSRALSAFGHGKTLLAHFHALGSVYWKENAGTYQLLGDLYNADNMKVAALRAYDDGKSVEDKTGIKNNDTIKCNVKARTLGSELAQEARHRNVVSNMAQSFSDYAKFATEGDFEALTSAVESVRMVSEAPWVNEFLETELNTYRPEWLGSYRVGIHQAVSSGASTSDTVKKARRLVLLDNQQPVGARVFAAVAAAQVHARTADPYMLDLAKNWIDEAYEMSNDEGERERDIAPHRNHIRQVFEDALKDRIRPIPANPPGSDGAQNE